MDRNLLTQLSYIDELEDLVRARVELGLGKEVSRQLLGIVSTLLAETHPKEAEELAKIWLNLTPASAGAN